MHHFQRISASVQTIKAQLFDHERIIQEREGVGLYDGKERSAVFDDGRLYLTNRRLIYIDSAEPYRNSRYLDLHQVKQTEYWVGFLKSSAKITLVLHTSTQEPEREAEQSEDEEALPAAAQAWTCHVCGFRNSVSGGNKCTLCGVTRSNLPTPVASGKPSRLATPVQSTPPSRPESPLVQPREDGAFIACPACTYLNHPSMQRCEICDTILGTASARPRRTSTPAPRTPTRTSSSPSTPAFVKLSFRKGGDKSFYAALKDVLQAKEWDNSKLLKRKTAVGGERSEHTLATYGIDGILRTIDIDARDREDDMQEALGDLEALKKRAQDMVRMAEAFNTKLASTEAQADDATMTTVARSLKSMGLENPVIAAADSEEEQYHRKLAAELGTVLLGPADRTGATQSIMAEGDPAKELIGLDEVWCLWNRARGVALVSPQDLHDAAHYLPEVTKRQVRLQVFKSGLNVLHLPSFGRDAFGMRMSAMLKNVEDQITFGMSTLDIAREEGISVVLTMQLLELLEDGDLPSVVRDEGDSRSGVRWQLNLFEELERLGTV